MHRDVFYDRSTYFQSECDLAQGAGRRRPREMNLDKFEPYQFMIYLEHLYNEDAELTDIAYAFAKTQNPTLPGQAKDTFTNQRALLLLCELWVLGNFLGDELFNISVMQFISAKVIDPLIAAQEKGAGSFWGTATYVEKNAAPGSDLYSWLIDELVRSMRPKVIDRLREHCSNNFVLQLFKAYTAWVAIEYEGAGLEAVEGKNKRTDK